MRALQPLPTLVVLLALACAAVFARPACAEDEAPAPPLARLKPAEQEIVRAKIPGFDALPLDKQEQIVRNVEWLRTADPAAREMLQRRFDQARAAHLGGQQVGGRADNFKHLGPRQGLALRHGLALAGLGRAAWLDLPEAIRSDPHAKAVEQLFFVAFHRKFWGRAFQGLDAEAALAYLPPDSVPEEMRRRLETSRREAEAVRNDPKAFAKAMGRVKETVLQARAFLATDLVDPAAVPQVPAARAQLLLALGERLRDLARPAYDKTLEDFTAKWGQMGPRAWSESVAKLAQPPEPPPEVRRKVEALQAVIALESLGAFLARHPALAAPADALLKKALVDELGMASDEFTRLPARGDGAAQEQRTQALKQWLERSGLPRDVIRQGLQQMWQKRWGAPGGAMPGGPGGRGKPGGAPPARPPEPVKREGDEKPAGPGR